ncbi:MAG: beta-glucosidase [Ktedonobacterales bacterium]|nr:beta-glucosidase [Ktedonobacterales bacterium]
MSQPVEPRAGRDFLWGTATAAYQIEGAYNEDGKGPSIWDTYAHTPGKIERGETGDVACDHYHRWADDVELMAQLGLRAYRFSLAWARILPDGRGAVNAAGLAFYDRLVDGLLARGITPFITLYHWDLPQALQERGGWVNRDTAASMCDYADVVTRRLGDRVKHWITLNEPHISSHHGYVTGEHAPGLHAFPLYYPTTHHLLLGHGLALQPIRENVPDAKVGVAFSLSEMQPATDRNEDFDAMSLGDDFHNGAYLDAVLRGRYPDSIATAMPEDVIQGNDMAVISGKTDMIGINYYMRLLVRAHKDAPGFEITPWQPGPRTEMGWEQYPQGLSYWVRRIANDFPDHDIYITENGAAFPDVVDDAGRVDDQQRIAFLRDHTRAALETMAATQARLKGYFVWSLLDNFEWAYGTRPRFGLIHTNFKTQERIIKESGHWYRRLIEAGSPDDAG